MSNDDVKDTILAILIIVAVLALSTGVSLSGWIDGADPAPGTDVVPDWLEGGGR